MVFYIQDSDDVYGLFRFDPTKEQSIQSQPTGRFLSLSFIRDGGTLGDVSMTLTALYIPAGPIDPSLARDQILNVSRSVNVAFERERAVHVTLPIRNDAFLQNGAHFLIQVTRLQISWGFHSTVLATLCFYTLLFRQHFACMSRNVLFLPVFSLLAKSVPSKV